MKLNAGGLSSLLVGREREMQTLKAYIGFSQHTIITAPRRYGKTTLVNKLLHELQDEYLVVKLDVFAAVTQEEMCDIYLNAIYQSVGIANFLHQVKESIFSLLEKFTLAYEIEGIKLGYEIAKEQDLSKKIEKTFHFANQFSGFFSKKMIVFMDEFGDVEKFGQDFIKKLRSYMQTHENVIYIFAGSQTSVMNDIFLNKDNAFFNFASLMSLDFLEPTATEEFLQTLHIEQKTLSNEAKIQIRQATNFHPFYLIKTLQEAYIEALFASSPTIESIHIHQALKKILSDNNAYFESIWHKINHKKHKGSIFEAHCAKHETSQSLTVSSSYKSQLVKELKNESLLFANGVPTDPLFCLWLKEAKWS